jgi:hypothetical protein
MSFALIDYGDSLLFYCDSDCGGLAVIEGSRGRTNNELFEMPCPYVAHGNDLN